MIQPVEKRRPMGIAVKSQREIMVVLRDHPNGETAEWLDIDDVETDHDKVQQELSATSVAVNVLATSRSASHNAYFTTLGLYCLMHLDRGIEIDNSDYVMYGQWWFVA